METFLTSLKADVPRAEISLPYLGTLNKLVNFDSELNAGASFNQTKRSGHFCSDEKLLTHLSSNPSQFEKDLRAIVLDVYSDHGPGDKGHGDLIGVESNTGTLLNSPLEPLNEDVCKRYKRNLSYSVPLSGVSLRDSARTSPQISMKCEETALIDNRKDTTHSSLAQLQQVPPSFHSDLKTYAGDADLRQETTSLKSTNNNNELQENLQHFELTDAPELLRDRFGSTESRSFSDSGIHLEFFSSDNEITEKEPKGNKGGNGDDSNSGLDSNERNVGLDGNGGKTRCTEDSLTTVDPVRGNRNSPTLDHHSEAFPRQLEDCMVVKDGYHEQHFQELAISVLPPTNTSVVSSTPMKDVHRKMPLNKEALVLVNSLDRTSNNTRCELRDEEYSVHENREQQLELANMEGRLESLTTEYQFVLQEKKELHERVKAIEDREEMDEKKNEIKPNEVQVKLEKFLEKEIRLEKKIVELQKNIDDKDKNMNEAEERLKVSQENIEKLQETLKVLEAELESKTSNVESLQNELGELKRTLAEAQIVHEGQLKEMEVLRSDVSTLVKAKTWLLKQLEMAKDSHVKLELELSEYKSTVFSQSKQVEQLKLENARTTQQLIKTQDKTVEEKARILKHLEKVEEDLVNQDSVFRTMQVEKETIQRELTVKIESLQKENSLLQNLTGAAKKLEDDLKILRDEINVKSNLLKKLKDEKNEVDQQLKVARSANDVSDKKIKALSFKLEKNENELKMSANELEKMGANVQELEQKNVALEASIADAQEEKEALDSAVQLLRLELDKVERRFKMMKRELTSKTNHLEEVTRQKDGFVNELRILRDEMEKHASLLETLRATICMRDENVAALHNDKVKLLADVRGLRDNLENTRTNFDETKKEKESLHEQLQCSNSRLSHLEKRLHESSLEKAKIEGELESTQLAAREQEIANKTQRECLKQEMDDVRKNLQHEITRHRDKAINLQQEVEYFKGELREINKKHKNELRELKEKITQVEASKMTYENEIKKKLKVLFDTSVNEVKEHYENKINQKEKDLASMREEKEEMFIKYTELEERARNTADLQKDKIIALDRELQFARSVLNEQRVEIEKLSKISVELEREKGRLVGLKMSQKTLRDHCSKMEQSGATREGKITEMNSLLETLQKEKELQRKEADRKVDSLETTLVDNNEIIDKLRSCLNSERRENTQLRARLNESEEEVKRVLTQLAATRLDLENTNDKYEKFAQDLKNSDDELRNTKLELQDSKTLACKLENEYKILKEQEKVKDGLASSVEWKLRQCRKEVDYAKEQLRLSDETHQIEIENLKTACQVAKSEAAYLRRELTLARKSKCENQDRYFTSRDEVLTTKQETEYLKQELFASSQQLRYLKSAILNARDVTEIQEFVKNEEDTSMVTTTTRESTNEVAVYSNSPLIGLRDCMSLLRNQISSLQEQMNKHSDAVCSTASSWRSFEKNVQILQNDCDALQRKQLLSAEKDTII